MHRQRFCRLGRGVAIARRGTGRGDADRSAEKCRFSFADSGDQVVGLTAALEPDGVTVEKARISSQ